LRSPSNPGGIPVIERQQPGGDAGIGRTPRAEYLADLDHQFPELAHFRLPDRVGQSWVIAHGLGRQGTDTGPPVVGVELLQSLVGSRPQQSGECANLSSTRMVDAREQLGEPRQRGR